MSAPDTPRLESPALDLPRMRRARHARLLEEMDKQGIEALWLLGPGHLRYAVGATVLPTDSGYATYQRPAALITRHSDAPHLFTPQPEGAPPELPAECIHAPLYLESEAGVADAARRVGELLGGVSSAPLAVDEFSPALYFGLRRHLDVELCDAAPVLAEVELCKTPDEIECVRRAQHINQLAMLDVQAALRPGLRQSDLSALFFARIYELGITANGIDPIWQVMAPRIADGPWTTHGGVAFPTCTTDRLLREGDMIWVDSGIDYHGYASDFGRTWIVGSGPTARQLDQAKRWLEVVDAVLDELRPGVTGRDLTRRARDVAGGTKPWLEHFYLIHGIGTEPAEQPLIGTDRGDEFDESLVMEPGMVLVLEPAIWDDGFGGYRSEEIVAVTETGYAMLSDHTHAPYEEVLGS